MDNTPMVHCPGQTDVEYRTEFTMWCMMSSPLIVSTDIRNMTKSLNGKTIDIRVNGIGNPRNRLVNIFLWSVSPRVYTYSYLECTLQYTYHFL